MEVQQIMSQQIIPLEEITYGLERESRIKELINMSKQSIQATPSTSLLKIEKQLAAYNDPRLKPFGEQVDRERKIRRILHLTIQQKVNMQVKDLQQTLNEIYELRDPRLDKLQELFVRAHQYVQQSTKSQYLMVPIWKMPWGIYKNLTFKYLPLTAPPKKQEQNIIKTESSDDQFDTIVSCQAEKNRRKKQK